MKTWKYWGCLDLFALQYAQSKPIQDMHNKKYVQKRTFYYDAETAKFRCMRCCLIVFTLSSPLNRTKRILPYMARTVKMLKKDLFIYLLTFQNTNSLGFLNKTDILLRFRNSKAQMLTHCISLFANLFTENKYVIFAQDMQIKKNKKWTFLLRYRRANYRRSPAVFTF